MPISLFCCKYQVIGGNLLMCKYCKLRRHKEPHTIEKLESEAILLSPTKTPWKVIVGEPQNKDKSFNSLIFSDNIIWNHYLRNWGSETRNCEENSSKLFVQVSPKVDHKIKFSCCKAQRIMNANEIHVHKYNTSQIHNKW